MGLLPSFQNCILIEQVIKLLQRPFAISEDLPGVTLNIPAFMNGKKQLLLKKRLKQDRLLQRIFMLSMQLNMLKNRTLKGRYPTSRIADLKKVWAICYLINFLPLLVSDTHCGSA